MKSQNGFLQIALGSLNELQTQLELSVRLGFVNGSTTKGALDLCVEIEEMLVTLIKKLNANVKR